MSDDQTRLRGAWFFRLAVIIGLIGSSSCFSDTYPDRKLFPNVKVEFVNDTTGWIVGPRLLHSTDGGRKWTTIRDGGQGTVTSEIANYEEKSIQFINPTSGWTLGQDGKSLFKTIDGGQTWVQASPIPMSRDEVPLQSIFFISADEGWAVGQSVYHTSNGGQRWEPLSETPRKDYERKTSFRIAEGYDPALWFLDSRIGAMVRKDGDVYRTSDGGRTWELVWRVDKYLTYVFFQDNQRGWIVGSEGFTGRTMDSGLTWIAVQMPTRANLNSIFFIDSMGWIVGNEGTILYTKDSGTTWREATIVAEKARARPRLASVSFADSLRGWAVGGNPYDEFNGLSKPSNVVLATDDGGRTWRAIQP